MTQNLKKNFVDLSDSTLTTNRIPKFALNHGKGGLDIGTLMIMSQESLTIQHEELVHPLPESRATTRNRVFLERDIRRSPDICDSGKVAATGICLISRHFSDIKSLGRTINQRSQHRGIMDIAGGDFNAGDCVGFSSAHDVAHCLEFFCAELGIDLGGWQPYLIR